MHDGITADNVGEYRYSYRYKTTGSWSSAQTGLLSWDGDLNCAYASFYSSSSSRIYEITITSTAFDSTGNYQWEVQSTTGVSLNNFSYASGWYPSVENDGVYTFSTTRLDDTPTLAPQSGVGTFTPTQADYVSGGRIKIPWMGTPRMLAVWREGGFDGAELYEPVKYLMFNPSGDGIHFMSMRFYGNPSSTNGYGSAGNPDLDATEFPLTDNAISNARCIYVDNTGVYFKTYGDYRFRVGTTYRYEIY